MSLTRKIASLLLGFYIFLVAGCGGGGTDSTGPMTEMMSGVVFQTSSLTSPVSGARISAGAMNTTTDVNGFYALSNLVTGPITIETQDGAVTVFDLEVASTVTDTTVNFVLNPPSADSSDPAVSVKSASLAAGPGNFIDSASEPLSISCVDSRGSYCEVTLSGRITRDSDLNYYVVSKKSGNVPQPFIVHYPRIRTYSDSWRYVTQLPMDELEPVIDDVHRVYLVSTSEPLNFLQDVQFGDLLDIPTVTYVSAPRSVVLRAIIIID